MHGKLWRSDIDGLDACFGGHHWSNSGAAKIVVSHNELLKWDSSLTGEHFKHRGANRVSHVSLIGVDLDDDTFLNSGHVLGMVLLCVVRVNCVCHVSTKQETPMDSLEVLLLIECCERAEDALCDLHGHVAVGALG